MPCAKLDVWDRLALTLAVAPLAAACGASDPASERSADRDNVDELAQYARLTFVRVPASPSGLDYALAFDAPLADLAVELSDGKGIYQVTSDAQGLLELPAELADSFQVSAHARSPDGRIEVYDYESGAAHTWQSPSIERSGASVATIRIPSGWSGDGYRGPRAAAPFAVLDTARRVLGDVERLTSRALPALRINWSERNLPVWGRPEDGLIGATRWDGAALHLLGAEDVDTDEYDEGVIAHELGHFVLEALGRSASPGGNHDLERALDPRLAFSEGFASFFAARLLAVASIIDTFGPRQSRAYENDLEKSVAEDAGWFSERSVQSLLYELAGSAGVAGHAGLAPLGLPELLKALETERSEAQGFTTIFSFLQALRGPSGASASALDGLIRRHGIEPAADAFGRGETNDGGEPDNLPLYRELMAPGSVEFDLYGDTANGLGLVRFFSFVGAEKLVQLSVEATAEVELVVQGRQARRANFSLRPVIEVFAGAGERYVVAVRGNPVTSASRCTLQWSPAP
jgi:hypothetical protein